jgi:hypothetical protein
VHVDDDAPPPNALLNRSAECQVQPLTHLQAAERKGRFCLYNVAMRLILLAALTAGACSARAEQTPKVVERTIVWHQLGSWSGSGNRQTESFTSDSGTLRVRWEVADARQRNGERVESVPPSSSLRPAVFRLTAHSAISGRVLQQVVDQTGSGSGLGYVQQDPHVFYLNIESNDVNWKFTVEEAIEYP